MTSREVAFGRLSRRDELCRLRRSPAGNLPVAFSAAQETIHDAVVQADEASGPSVVFSGNMPGTPSSGMAPLALPAIQMAVVAGDFTLNEPLGFGRRVREQAIAPLNLSRASTGRASCR